MWMFGECIYTSVMCEAKRGNLWGATEHFGCLGPSFSSFLSATSVPLSQRLSDRSRGIPYLWEVSQKRTPSGR